MPIKTSLTRNATANVIQAVAGAGLLFGLYRYINTTLGVDKLGIWSVVLAAVSASRLADLGLSAGVTRFVARDLACDDALRASDVVETASLTLAVSVGVAMPLIFPILEDVLAYVLQGEDLALARKILPYALFSLWLNILGAVFQGGLDGCQRMDLRTGLVVGGQAALLLLAFVLVPDYGLVGLAWAQIGQSIILLVGGWLLLYGALPTARWFPRQWRWPVLREMLGYGVNVQAATVFMLLMDPVTKGLLARFGSTSTTAYFEMANQVVLKTRAVIVTANRAIVPHVAEMVERAPEQLAKFYRQNLRVLTFVTVPAFALLISWREGISWMLIGEYRSAFGALVVLLAAAWAFNILASPAYFVNMGTGFVGWNTLSHATMGILNGGLAWVLGTHFGGFGVALAYGAALVIGSVILLGSFERRYSLSWTAGFGREQVWIGLAGGAAVVISWIVPLRPTTGGPLAALAATGAPLLIVSLSVWFHPLRSLLIARLFVRDEVR